MISRRLLAENMRFRIFSLRASLDVGDDPPIPPCEMLILVNHNEFTC
jgi:hypothetical protein